MANSDAKHTEEILITVSAVAMDCIVFVRVFSLCAHDNSRTAAPVFLQLTVTATEKEK